MKIYKIQNLSEYRIFAHKTKESHAEHLTFLDRLLPREESSFELRGYSYTANKEVDFLCDFKYSAGYPDVNWRERVICPVSQLNNRTRASVHFFDLTSNTFYLDDIFIFEQTTPLYAHLKKNYPRLIGAEFLGGKVPLGQTDERGIRNEDARNLSFADNSLKAILSFDVFEHIYDYRKAFRECYRVLAPSGCMIFTVPFDLNSHKNIEMAIELSSGEIKHILPPEYHGDPMSGEGILCYRHYGWSMLDDLRNIGFTEAYASIFTSESMGYCTNQIMFYCKK